MPANQDEREKAREDALEFVRRRALIPNRMHPTDRQAEDQERAETSLADAMLTFARQYSAAALARSEGVSENGLKPCPFCGKPPITEPQEEYYTVTCSTDNCILGNMAVSPPAWNRRSNG